MARHLYLLVLPCPFILACSISPQPLPPPETSLSVQLSELQADNSSGSPALVGKAGSVNNPPASIRVWPLDDSLQEYSAKVNADGSFLLPLPSPWGISYRIQAERDSLFSAPVDITVGNTEGPVSGYTPTSDPCVVVPAAMDYGQVALSVPVDSTVQVENSCDQSVEITNIFIKYDNRDFELLTKLPIAVLANKGDRTPIAVRIAPQSVGIHADLLLIQTSTGKTRVSLRAFAQ